MSGPEPGLDEAVRSYVDALAPDGRALFDRFSSRGKAEYADKVLSAMRQQFGGHYEKQAEEEGKTPDADQLPVTTAQTSGPEFTS